VHGPKEPVEVLGEKVEEKEKAVENETYSCMPNRKFQMANYQFSLESQSSELSCIEKSSAEPCEGSVECQRYVYLRTTSFNLASPCDCDLVFHSCHSAMPYLVCSILTILPNEFSQCSCDM
jgi:hypothetical protein